jgi:hypothetical protein
MNVPKVCRAALSVAVAALLSWAQEPGSGSQTGAGLKIVVLEGEDGVNIIKKKTAVKPVLEVRDKNDLPVAGVAVVIGLGAAGVFDSGQKEVTITTDATGRVTVPNFRPTMKGPVQIQARATYQGQTASVTVHQTNFTTVAQALKAGKTPGSSSGSRVPQHLAPAVRVAPPPAVWLAPAARSPRAVVCPEQQLPESSVV